MIQDLVDLKMSDRFNLKIRAHPRLWSKRKPVHKFKLVLYFDGTPARVSHHLIREDAEQSVREFLELGLSGEWEIYEI